MPAVAEENSDELEVSAPFEILTAHVLDGSFSSDASSTKHEERPKREGSTSADQDEESSEIGDAADNEDQNDSWSLFNYHQAMAKFAADSSADIVSSVPITGAASPRRLSLIGASPSSSNYTQALSAATAPTLRGSILSNLFAPLQINPSVGGGRATPHSDAPLLQPSRRGSLLAAWQAVRSPSSSSNKSSSSTSLPYRSQQPSSSCGTARQPTRRRSKLVLGARSPPMPRRLPSDDSSPSSDSRESFSAAAQRPLRIDSDRPGRQPVRRRSLMNLLQSVTSRMGNGVESGDTFSSLQPSRLDSSVDATHTATSLPKQPARRPSERHVRIDTAEASFFVSRRMSLSDGGKAPRRSSWKRLAVDRPSKSENEALIASCAASSNIPHDNLPERAASEPSRRGSLLGLMLFFRADSGVSKNRVNGEIAATHRGNRPGSNAGSSTDGSDEESEEYKKLAHDWVPREPRRRGGTKPGNLLRRHASCDCWVEGTGAGTALSAGARVPSRSAGAEEARDRRSSMVAILPSRKPCLEPTNPLYRVSDNGQQATILCCPKNEEEPRGHRRWSLISNLPCRGMAAVPSSSSESGAVVSPGICARSVSGLALVHAG
jgi:hypothetical protein